MSASLHQRSLITCITMVSVWGELPLLNIKLVILGSGWPLFRFSPLVLVPSRGVDFLKVCRCGQRMLKMCRNGGGWIIVCRGPLWYLLPVMIFFRSRSTIQVQVSPLGISATVRAGKKTMIRMYFCVFGRCMFYFFPPSLSFSAAPSGWPLAMSASLDELWKRAISGSGSDVLAQNPVIKDHSRCRSDIPPRRKSVLTAICPPHLIQRLPGQCNKPGQARSCFVRLGIASKYYKLFSWKAAKKTNVFFLQRLRRFFSLSFWPFLFWLAKCCYS